jgi:hypothetical protein|tara:strand:+ start:16 stop:183 length:168 start_codon:yes stop_codon:yes gene_type:complete
METHKTDPVEYQTRCEILMDLCIKWLDDFPVITIDDYDNLMVEAQEACESQEKKN